MNNINSKWWISEAYFFYSGQMAKQAATPEIAN